MALSNAGKNVMLDALGGVVSYVSLHTADPGSSGLNEVSGGFPAYARRGITWNPASEGVLDSSNAPEFNVPASTTITHFGMWSAATGGTFYGGGPLSATETYAAQGVYTLDDADVTLT